MPQASSAVERRIAKILRERKEPHGKSFKDVNILKGVEINESGIAELWIKPTHPYCPCCKVIKNTKGILACHIEVVSIPQAKRWTAAINE